ncbi:MAG: hypothetical protein ACI91J_002585, partial [Yoonia sp.]
FFGVAKVPRCCSLDFDFFIRADTLLAGVPHIPSKAAVGESRGFAPDLQSLNHLIQRLVKSRDMRYLSALRSLTGHGRY